MTDNLYEILGVRHDATQAEIQAAYRQAAKQHHPDVGGDGDRFKALNEVYEILSDPEKRRFYDTNDFWDPEFDANIAEAAATMFLATVKSHKGDPIKITIARLLDEVASYRARRAGLEREVAKMHKAIQRVIAAPRKQEKLVGAIQFSICETENDIRTMKRKIVIGDAIRAYLSDVTWAADEDENETEGLIGKWILLNSRRTPVE